MEDPYDLQRFVQAQASVYPQVCRELAAGTKTGHWMWFIFPQMRGLGQSALAHRFGIASVAEAQAYWQHPLLGQRLKDCTELVLSLEGRTAHQIFGSTDELKFRSSMTLFAQAVPQETAFPRALDRYCDGRPDPRTLALLGQVGAG